MAIKSVHAKNGNTISAKMALQSVQSNTVSAKMALQSVQSHTVLAKMAIQSMQNWLENQCKNGNTVKAKLA